ncbi:MAG: GMC family oxidoreductase [Nocardioides sp.]|uniref:GMC oxidoreductase n=1 Tax=Nocardioides sp. TaxID=35761 RepID=UPI0039E4DEF8
MAEPQPSVEVDVVVVGSGAGGGTLARGLAGRDASVLVVERGGWLPQEKENWDPTEVWRKQRYRENELWLNRKGQEFQPFMHYLVGGNTKFWGAVLYRLREEDFTEIAHADGVSPAWPIDYQTLAPFYDRAEEIYQVHGEVGSDPTDPDRKPFPHPPVPHEPPVAAVVEQLRDFEVTPSYLPLALISPGEPGGCILCNTCNSFPCLVRGKADADTVAMTPALEADNIALWTHARVEQVLTDGSGRRATGVVVRRGDELVTVRAGVVVLSAGAVNSAALLLRSATAEQPLGLANSSGLVGRRFMAHHATMMEAFHPFRVNETVFQKTVGINDFYRSAPGRPYPLGNIQSQGRAHAPIVKAAAPIVPLRAADAFVRRGMDWLAMTEDLPDPGNRVSVTRDGRIRLDYRGNSMAPHTELVRESVRLFRRAGYWKVMTHMFKNENTTHQCGTLVFGDDPRTSVLDPWCRAHDLDNLYVVDASFFPSSAAVNPGLTVIAQALRVADHLSDRYGWAQSPPPSPSPGVAR